MKLSAALFGLACTALGADQSAKKLPVHPRPASPPPIPEWQFMTMTRNGMQPLLMALDAFNTDNNRYPAADSLPQLLTRLVTEGYLPPDYSGLDGWDQPYTYAYLRTVPGDPPGFATRYRLGSAGSDRQWRGSDIWHQAAHWLASPAEDLIYEDGVTLTRFIDPDEPEHDRYFASARRVQRWMWAVEAFNTDNNSYPPVQSILELFSHLAPDYMYALGVLDGLDDWRHEFRVETWSDSGNASRPNHYCIGSAGGNGVWERERLRDYPYRITSDYWGNMVACDGVWRQIADDPELTPMQRYRVGLAKIKTVASALESYQTDYNTYPAGDDIAAMLALLIQGGYLSGIPDAYLLNGWYFPLKYKAYNCTANYCADYRIGEPGADGIWELPDLAGYPVENITDLRQDTILWDGQFVRQCDDQCPLGTGALPVPSLRLGKPLRAPR